MPSRRSSSSSSSRGGGFSGWSSPARSSAHNAPTSSARPWPWQSAKGSSTPAVTRSPMQGAPTSNSNAAGNSFTRSSSYGTSTTGPSQAAYAGRPAFPTGPAATSGFGSSTASTRPSFGGPVRPPLNPSHSQQQHQQHQQQPQPAVGPPTMGRSIMSGMMPIAGAMLGAAAVTSMMNRHHDNQLQEQQLAQQQAAAPLQEQAQQAQQQPDATFTGGGWGSPAPSMESPVNPWAAAPYQQPLPLYTQSEAQWFQQQQQQMQQQAQQGWQAAQRSSWVSPQQHRMSPHLEAFKNNLSNRFWMWHQFGALTGRPTDRAL